MTKQTLTRKKYWIAIAIAFAAATVLYSIPGLCSGQAGRYIVAILFLIAAIFIQVKRLRDANKSLLFLLLHLIPGFGTFVAVVVIGCFNSNYESNKWINKDIDG